jgi:AcrR family transcriptional regulator
MAERRRTRGRPRDADIDARVLEVTRRQLADGGYDGLSVAAVAAEAQTTRAALYRRWPSKADLATAAIADLSDAHLRPPTDDPLADLTRELDAFRRGVSRPQGLALAGAMLLEGVDPTLVARYREKIVEPRRARLREILERGRAAGAFAPEVSAAEIDLAVSTLTGSWYGFAVAGRRPPRDWARRLAQHTWRALGARV